MDDQKLQQWVERVSLRDFAKPFLHKARFNTRLSSVGGRYLLGSHDIEMSWKYWTYFGNTETEAIIKHELCHYHLHLEKRGYRHRDAEFRHLLAKVGGRRFCHRIPTSPARRGKSIAVEVQVQEFDFGDVDGGNAGSIRNGGNSLVLSEDERLLQKGYRWVLTCMKCGSKFPRLRRMDPKRYACGKCKGKLQIRTLL